MCHNKLVSRVLVNNSQNVFLDWVCQHLLAPRNVFCEAEAIRRITDCLVTNSISPWYSNVGDNELFNQESCLALTQALLSISRLIRQMDMQSLAKDLALIIHRHLKKQAMCGHTGSAFRAEHPVSLGKSSLDCHLDSQISSLMAAVLPHYRGHMHCLPVKMVKQVFRREVVNKIKKVGLDIGLAGMLDKNMLRKEQKKEAFTPELGTGD